MVYYAYLESGWQQKRYKGAKCDESLYIHQRVF